MIAAIKTKPDLIKALGSREVRFIAELEVVNENGVRSAADKARTLLRQNKKLHIVIIERE